jgi:hypothetical protein
MVRTMSDLAKWMMLAGASVLLLGVVLWILSKIGIPFGRLPGDISVERGKFRLYFPLTTSLIISALLTFVFWLVRK